MKQYKKLYPAFTIIELLIVIVVIAILAAITIVAYNGITNNAKESALKSDLSTAAKKLQVAKTQGDGNLPLAAPANTATTTYQYNRISANQFCLTATSPSLPGKVYNITESGTIQTGDCPLAPATTMQTFTSAHCAAQPVYNGSNPSAIQTLTDSRGGTTRTYEVAKLADNNCWMLTNLKLGSETSTITLTPSDSNVASNFTLPQLTTSGADEYDDSRTYGPIPGDTGSGSTNYGYLYNWPAATAGETRTTKPADSGDANYSICPANWRLPTGGASGAGEFAMLNAKMNSPSATAGSTTNGAGFVENWQTTGPFKGVFSGRWWGDSFSNQSGYSFMWSRSTNTSPDSAYILSFYSGYVYLTNIFNRSQGLTVRCLLS